jgi:hypothetical protein
MAREVLPNAALDHLRTLGDPALTDLLEQHKVDLTASSSFAETMRQAIGSHGLQGALGHLAATNRKAGAGLALLFDALARQAADEFTPDWTLVRTAQKLFARYSPEISGALLLAALPQSYATKHGSRVLAATGSLEHDLVRRVRGTAQFLLVVTQIARNDAQAEQLWVPAATTPGVSVPTPWQMCTALRFYHHTIRLRLGCSADQFGGEPLNQEDLLGMLLTFSITVFEVLERYGICWTAKEQEAYLHLWDFIGSYLGIGSARVVSDLVAHVPAAGVVGSDWCGLRPPSVADTHTLLEQIRKREWEDPGLTSAIATTIGTVGPSSLTDGRLLAGALLDELVTAMPPSLKLMPLAMMRTLAPDIVRRRLSLGHNGIVLRALDLLPRRRHVVDRFTHVRMPNGLSGRIMRSLANDVATRATVRFLNDPSFVIPGQEDWSLGFGRCF